MRLTLFLFSLLLTGLTGCYRQAYYVSPLVGSSTDYKAQQLASDSILSAVYASGMFSAGGTNYRLRDGVVNFQGSLYHSLQQNNFNFYYGLGGSVGNYHVTAYHDGKTASYVDTNYLNARSGNYFYGSGALHAGMNFVVPFDNGGEWRVLGLHGSVYKEFGDFLRYRQSLPPTKVTGVIASSSLASLGLSTEIIGKVNKGNLGFKMQYVFFTGSNYKHIVFGNQSPDSDWERKRYNLFTTTIQYTQAKNTFFIQPSFGTRVFSYQMGFCKRLTGHRK